MKNKKKINIFLNILIIIFVFAIIGVIIYIIFAPSNNKIENKKIEKIELDNENISIILGKQAVIHPIIIPSDATNKKVIWKSEDTSIATVDNGFITAISEGETNIIVSDEEEKIKAICHVKVVINEIEKIELSDEYIQLEINQEKKITAKVYPQNATFNELTFSSSDNNIVTVDQDGNVLGKNVGEAEIIVTDSRKKIEERCKVTVKKSLKKIELDKHNLELTIGNEIILNTTFTPADATNKSIKWISSNNSIVSVENGKLIPKKAGEVTITVMSNDNNEIKDSCKVTVKSFGAYKHVFIIGVDGVGAAFSKVSASNFNNIFKDYAYTHTAKTESITVSAQNWGSILTGVACETHKYDNDSISNNAKLSNSKYLSIFYYVKKALPNTNLASIVNWSPINKGIIENDIGITRKNSSSDANVTKDVINYLNSGNSPSLLFVHFDSADHNAHTYGGFSKEYYDAVNTIDNYIGQIYNAIKTNGLLDDSLFIVVADHGETTNGHGGNTIEEKSVVLAVRGYSVNKMTINSNTHNRDVSAIALYALGVNKPNHFISNVPEGLFKYE